MKRSNNSHISDSSQAIAAALEKEVSPERLAAALSSALDATTVSRSGIVETDYRTRLQAASLILNYQVGRPKERETPIPAKPETISHKEFIADLRQSPAFRREMRRLLEEAERTPDDNG